MQDDLHLTDAREGLGDRCTGGRHVLHELVNVRAVTRPRSQGGKLGLNIGTVLTELLNRGRESFDLVGLDEALRCLILQSGLQGQLRMKQQRSAP